MAEKLSWTELRRTLAARAGVSEKTAGEFLAAFNAQLIEALKQDKQVKINGLGTFRLQAVAPRRSVNVSTGEEMMIEGYNKLVFAPEAGVKELVESQPSEEKQPAQATIDPIKKLGEQAQEIVGLLDELNDIQPAEPEQPEQPEIPDSPETPAEPESPEQPESPKTPAPAPKPEPAPRKNHFLRDTLICVVILLLLLLIGYFFLRAQLTNWIESLGNKEQVEYVLEGEESDLDNEPVTLTPQPQTYDKILKIERITPGSRLAWISKKYYGDKAYWPYLYDANKDRIPNPSHITIGTPVRVPKLTPEQLDLSSEQTRVNLEYLEREARKAMR